MSAFRAFVSLVMACVVLGILAAVFVLPMPVHSAVAACTLAVVITMVSVDVK